MNVWHHFGNLCPNGSEYCSIWILESLVLKKVDCQLKEVLSEPSELLSHLNLQRQLTHVNNLTIQFVGDVTIFIEFLVVLKYSATVNQTLGLC